jgi:hypothetical protein
MKRAIVLALSVILALTMAAPTVLAQGNGGAPKDVSDTFTVNPGDIPGTCSFPMQLELSGKGKQITQPDHHLAGPQGHRNEPRQPREPGKVQHHRFFSPDY